MTYDHILIRYGELALKGKNRKEFEKVLHANIKAALKQFENVRITRTFGRMYVELHGSDERPIIERLKNVFGIQSFSLAIKVQNELEAIQHAALSAFLRVNGKKETFKIAARRATKQFPIDSQKLNHLVGSYLLKNVESLRVDVHNPDVEVKVEVREQHTYISCEVIQGAGGLPVGTAGGKAFLLLSGGIDSPVACYLTMKRGVKVEAIHFHSPPFTNERAKQKVLDLARILTTYGGDLRVHLVPFTELQTYIHEKVPDRYEMTIMRRMMLRIAERIARKHHGLALATGESIGQVASQTLHSMNTINEVTSLPVIRPLVTMDKQEVVAIAKKIGTYETSILPYEDCCTIFLPRETITQPKREKARKIEEAIDFERYIEDAVERTETVTMTNERSSEDEAIDELF